MDVSEKRELYNGFGNGLAQAFEFAAIPLLFALFGWWLDGLLGVRDIFPFATVASVVVALVGVGARTYYRYKAEMDRHDAAGPWGRRAAATPTNAGTDRQGASA